MGPRQTYYTRKIKSLPGAHDEFCLPAIDRFIDLLFVDILSTLLFYLSMPGGEFCFSSVCM